HLMRSYDIVYLGSSFTNFDVDWLAYTFWSEYADEPYWNFPHWRNATYDSWRDQLLRATNYDDVYAAAIEMQKIWIYDCPMVICCEEELLSAYRTDHIDGIVNDARYGASGWWTNYRTFVKYSYNLHYGGTLRIGMLLGVDTFNFMLYSSIYTKKVLDNLYDSLIRQSPDGTDFPWLATSYFFETHEDNPAIQEGHTRIFFTIIENATWSDGTPLTALDVAYTMNYYRDAPGNPYGADLSEMTAAYNISNHQVIIEFNSESYWHIHTIGYKPIIPKHVFEVIGLDYWNSWNPSPPEEDMVTSGPYNITDQVPDEYVELSRNRNYFYTPRDLLSTELNPSESIPTDAGPIPLQHLFVTIPSVIVIIAVAIKWKRDSSAM
ncbi:MAG: ABC transporter substrate-binding protein, partial [Candidatus Thorarchaeota archaeon]